MTYTYKEGEMVHYSIGSVGGGKGGPVGHALVRGIATTEMPVIGCVYILEDCQGNFPNETYPFSCFACPEVWLSK